jgi:hypothetical protein
MSRPAKLADVIAVLNAGGFVRFTWSTGVTELIDLSGNSRVLDGRTYHAVLARADIRQTKTGSTEERNLVIELRQDPPQ